MSPSLDPVIAEPELSEGRDDQVRDSAEFPRPEPTGLPRKAVEDIAAKIASRLNFGPGDDLNPIVEKLGGRIKVRSWREGREDGAIHVEGPGNFTIFLSPYTGPFRDRFTIAHELGHYFLHSLFGEKKIKINREGSDPTEWEANWFAGGFLMPEESFRTEWEQFGGNIEAVAARFNVSTQTVKIRANTLGLPARDL
jgi:predicted transcriptional regulator